MVNENIKTPGKRCPHCEHELSSEEVRSIWSSYTTSLRQTMGGPKRMKRPCQSCGMVCASAREAWSHCRIPRGLNAQELLDYVLGRMPGDLAGLGIQANYGSLEALQEAVTDLLATKLKPSERKLALWYVSLVDKAMDKLEDVA